MSEANSDGSCARATEDDIRYAYRLLLGREPDEGGLAHHKQWIASTGLPTTDLAQAFLRSDEYLSRSEQSSVLQEFVFHGIKIYPWRGDKLIGECLLATGSYEPHVLPIFLESLREGDTVLDIGANIGIYSLLSAHRVGEKGTIFAIEPVAKNVRSICAGILANGFQNVSVVPVAASDKSWAIAVLRHSDSSNGIVDANLNSNSHTDYVPTQRLDDLLAGLSRLDVVKIDIEGHEPIAWAGLKSLVAKHRPLIFTEFSPVAIRNHSRVDPELYLNGLFEFANGKIAVLHQERTRVECTDPQEIMREWMRANQRFGLDGNLHLDLVVDTRL